MKWLTALKTDNDPITICRLMNGFRRKGTSIINLTLTAADDGFTLLALVETGADEVEHLRNFLRRTEGVTKVACYPHEPAEDLNVMFDDAEPPHFAGFLHTLPGANVTPNGQGRYLVEFPQVIESAAEAAEPGLWPN